MKDVFLFVFGGIIFSCITYISIFYIQGDRSSDKDNDKSRVNASEPVAFDQVRVKPITLNIEKEFRLSPRPQDTFERDMALMVSGIEFGKFLIHHPECFKLLSSVDTVQNTKRLKLECRFLPYNERN